MAVLFDSPTRSGCGGFPFVQQDKLAQVHLIGIGQCKILSLNYGMALSLDRYASRK
jgi:hypothetical protein